MGGSRDTKIMKKVRTNRVRLIWPCSQVAIFVPQCSCLPLWEVLECLQELFFMIRCAWSGSHVLHHAEVIKLCKNCVNLGGNSTTTTFYSSVHLDAYRRWWSGWWYQRCFESLRKESMFVIIFHTRCHCLTRNAIYVSEKWRHRLRVHSISITRYDSSRESNKVDDFEIGRRNGVRSFDCVSGVYRLEESGRLEILVHFFFLPLLRRSSIRWKSTRRYVIFVVCCLRKITWERLTFGNNDDAAVSKVASAPFLSSSFHDVESLLDREPNVAGRFFQFVVKKSIVARRFYENFPQLAPNTFGQFVTIFETVPRLLNNTLSGISSNTLKFRIFEDRYANIIHVQMAASLRLP